MITNERLPSVVILDINFAGYGVIRSLNGLGIKLIGFCDTRVPTPEVHSRLLNEVISFSSEKELLMLLKEFKQCHEPPVLFLNSDFYIELLSRNFQSIEGIFNICMPTKKVLDTCLSKVKFSEFAKANKLTIPNYTSIQFNDREIANQYIEGFNFPLVIKPFLRDNKWNESGYPKAFICNDENEAIELIKKAFEKTKSIIVQEFIPGDDSEIYFCLVYYNGNNQCIASFCGKKLTQWPVGIGSTASATSIDIEELEMETKKVFDMLKIVGFASMEYKRNHIDSKFYIIEPTIGRLNLQEFVATVHGINLPLIAYNSQTGKTIQSKVNHHKERIVYIDEWAYLKSALKQNRGIKKYISELKNVIGLRIVYRYFNLNDPMVFLYSLIFFIIASLKLGTNK